MKRVKRLCTETEESANKKTEEDEVRLTTVTDTVISKSKDSKEPKAKRDSRKRFINPSQRKIVDFAKKIENVEFLIKLEQKNKNQLEDNFETKISKLENTIEKNERELEHTLKELNVKESKIFEFQKLKLESFKKEIFKFETIYQEIEDRLDDIFKTINTIKQDECNVYNKTFIIYEDYLSFNNELSMLKIKMKSLKEVLVDIEKSYPKEFEFLLEDIQIERDLKALLDKKSTIIYLNNFNRYVTEQYQRKRKEQSDP